MNVWKRLVCRWVDHDWYAMSYPPARRRVCLRCRTIEESAFKDRVQRADTKSNNRTPGRETS